MVNMAQAIYIRRNHQDYNQAVISFGTSESASKNTKYTDQINAGHTYADSYSTLDHEIRVCESVDEILQLIAPALALEVRMIDG